MTDRPTRDLSTEPAEPIRFGRYRIQNLLNVGGMAEIYRGSVSGPAGFDKPVVVKRVRSQYAGNETFVHMFIDEAKICASLDHANLVSVFDFGESEGHYYLAMEFIDGLDLQSAHVRHRRRTGAVIPWQASVLVMREALRGLQFAHRATGPDGSPLGIVHRDIDLANIMVRRDGAVKVLDFGCAKAAKSIRSTETVAGVIKGKFGYMSPEQAQDQPLDARSDIFSASVVLHELLTGHRLFYGPDPLAVLKSVLSRPIPDPRSMNAEVPEELARVTLRGLARDREQRYPSAEAMADDLEAIVYEHRIPQSLVRTTFEPLMNAPEIQAAPAPSVEQRRLTLAAWTDSATESALRTFTGKLVVDPDTAATADPDAPTSAVASALRDAAASAPFIDATVVSTNPRWMLPEEQALADTVRAQAAANPAGIQAAPGAAANANANAAATPPVPLTAQKTQLLEQAAAPAPGAAAPAPGAPANASAAPPVPLTAQKTQLLEQATAPAPAQAATPPLSDQRTQLLPEVARPPAPTTTDPTSATAPGSDPAHPPDPILLTEPKVAQPSSAPSVTAPSPDPLAGVAPIASELPQPPARSRWPLLLAVLLAGALATAAVLYLLRA